MDAAAKNRVFTFKDCLGRWLPVHQRSEPFPHRDRHEIHMFDTLVELRMIPRETPTTPCLALQLKKKKRCWNTAMSESDVVFVFICFKKGHTFKGVLINCGWEPITSTQYTKCFVSTLCCCSRLMQPLLHFLVCPSCSNLI